jgi:hypothetical protein
MSGHMRPPRCFSARPLWHAALFAACLLLFVRPSSAGDWPFLRGPNFDGSAPSETLPDSWPAAGPPVLWERPLGQGYSSFAARKDRIWTLDQSSFQQNLVCLDAGSGRTLWEYPCGAPYEQLGIYPGPRSTPTLSENRLYFVSPDAVVHCVDATTGRGDWTVDLQKQFHGKGTEFGYSASVLVLNGMAIVPVGGEDAGVVALDAATGQVRWKNGSQHASYATPTPIQLNGQTLVVTPMQNHLVIHEPATGRLLWQESLSEGYDEHSISPLYREPILVMTAPFRAGATAKTLTLDAPSDDPATWTLKADHRWHSKEFSSDVLGSVVANDAIFGFDLRDPQAKAHRPSRGLFRCLDVDAGKTLWSSEEPGHANVLLADGKLLLFNDRGELRLARASREKYEELGRLAVFADEVCWTFPALSDGRVFVRTQSRAAAIQVSPPSTTPGDTVSPASFANISVRPVWSRFRLGQILGGEREHPFMRAALDELRRWYLASVALVWLTASLLSGAIKRGRCRRSPLPSGAIATTNELGPVLDVIPANTPRGLLVTPFLWIAFGIIATPLANLRTDDFVFTWPAALFGGLLLVVAGADVPNRWLRRTCDAAFLALCLGYFLTLRSQSLPHEWVFLIGLLPAAPFAWWWKRNQPTAGPIKEAFLTLAGFSTLFWTSAAWAPLRQAIANLLASGDQ